MEFLLNEKMIASVLGLIGGAIAVFIAPWITWGVERRKLQHQTRKETIDRWRSMVAGVSRKATGDFGDLMLALHEDTDFLSLKPHISEHTRSLIDSGNGMDHDVFEALLADIAAVEQKWKIL